MTALQPNVRILNCKTSVTGWSYTYDGLTDPCETSTKIKAYSWVTNTVSVRLCFIYIGLHTDNPRAGVLKLNWVTTGSNFSLAVIRHNMHLMTGSSIQTKYFLNTPVLWGTTPYFSQLSRQRFRTSTWPELCVYLPPSGRIQRDTVTNAFTTHFWPALTELNFLDGLK